MFQVTTSRPPREIVCVKCESDAQGDCSISPHVVTHVITCNSSCVTRKTLEYESMFLL